MSTKPRREALTSSLFDVEDADPANIKVRDMTVGPVAAREVREFTHRYHYTGHGGADLWRWGLWDGQVLLGVVSYNNGTRSSTAMVFGEADKSHVWHMGRLALADECPPNSESRLIGGSLRSIRNLFPHVWAVITFAAVDQGHIGYVYQATNAIYTGTGGAAYHYTDTNGQMRTQRPGKKQITVSEAKARGWVRQDVPPKHRYVYVLGSKTERKQRMKLLKFPSLPYPKATNSTCPTDANR